MADPLRLGIIGLGPLWRRRYLPALHRLREYFQIRVVCDPAYERALLHAKKLHCRAVSGPGQLVADDEVDAVLLLDTPWYRLWPVELACRAGKPVFCATALAPDDSRSDELQRCARANGVPIMMEMAHRLAPAMLRLQALFEEELGPPRLILGRVRFRRVSTTSLEPAEAAAVLGADGVSLLDWCLLGGQPTGVRARGSERGELADVVFDLPERRLVQITRYRSGTSRSSRQLEVVAERGRAIVRLPSLISWVSTSGRHTHRYPPTATLGQTLLRRFYDVVRGQGSAHASLTEACEQLQWLRAAARSVVEGRRIELIDRADSAS